MKIRMCLETITETNWLIDGWSYSLLVKHARPHPYEVGAPKIWWLSPKADSFNGHYLLALLEAAKHQHPVRHNGSVDYYRQIRAGHAYIKKPPKSRKAFDFDASVHPDGQPLPPKAKRLPTKKKSLLVAPKWRPIAMAMPMAPLYQVPIPVVLVAVPRAAAAVAAAVKMFPCLPLTLAQRRQHQRHTQLPVTFGTLVVPVVGASLKPTKIGEVFVSLSATRYLKQ
jgi:hypothetical protein